MRSLLLVNRLHPGLKLARRALLARRKTLEVKTSLVRSD
jgi:hypothetical protein